MAINPIVYAEKVVSSFLKYQLTAYPFADHRFLDQMRTLLSLQQVRCTPLLRGPFISLSRGFRQGESVEVLAQQSILHPHMRQLIPPEISHAYVRQENAIRSDVSGETTLEDDVCSVRRDAFIVHTDVLGVCDQLIAVCRQNADFP